MSERDEEEVWKLRAACLGLDPSLWFPEDNTTSSRENTSAALAICSGCPVQDECLEFGWRELFGTWGGMTQRERLLARREDFRQDKAWSVALALVSGKLDDPVVGYDEDDADPDERLIS